MFNARNIIGGFTAPGGVRVDIDSTLLWLIGLIIYFSLDSGLMNGLFFIAVLVGSILLHELGHAWGCRVQGVPVRRIVLYGGGGFCERRSAASAREQELIVIMGPLVNLALWAIAGVSIWLIFLWVTQAGPAAFTYVEPITGLMSFLYLVGTVNLALFLFNLIPVQPLDGGKLLYLWLGRVMPADRARRVTGTIGYVMSILWIPGMVLFFFTYGWILFFIPSIRDHKAMMEGRSMA